MKVLFLPSVICMLVPLVYLTFTLKGDLGITTGASSTTDLGGHGGYNHEKIRGGTTMLLLGVGALIFVPIFKTITHLPPYIGMMLGLGALWVVSEFINPHADEAMRKPYTASGALQRIDSSSVLFFLGILLAYGVVEPLGGLVEQKMEDAAKELQCIKSTLLASMQGYNPATAIEFGRKVLFSGDRPSFSELESHVKGKK